MGFWEQQNNRNADLGRSRNMLNQNRFAERYSNAENDLSDLISEDLEARLEQWDVLRCDPDHPEWISDPDFLNGLALFHPTCFDKALDSLARAFDRGNLFALFAMGDLFLLNFNFLIDGKRYCFGDDSFADGMLKASLICYSVSILHDPFSELAQERIIQYQEYFSDEDDFLRLIEYVSGKISYALLEHPEELVKLFSM